MPSIWTEAMKAKVMADYAAAEPTPETSTEIIKDIAEEIEQSPNGVRMVLVQAGVYVKKDASKTGVKTPKAGDKAPRVSKESSIAALSAIIEAKGLVADAEILDKLTGKAAVYFAGLLTAFDLLNV